MSPGPALRGEDLLREARELLDTPTRESVSGWPRAVAILARMALERHLRAYWTTTGRGALCEIDMRAQLNCARIYLGPAIAGELSYTWSGLSAATHHRPYELDPTAEELRALVHAVETVNAEISASLPSTATHAGGPTIDR